MIYKIRLATNPWESNKGHILIQRLKVIRTGETYSSIDLGT